MHVSVRMEEHPIEFVNVVPVNPLISKCQIKVCYVGDEPNRNRSIITKDVARQMANSLPGSPIVGYFNETEGDFEEHNRMIDISNGKFEIKDTTRPYGFVDLNAKVWFAKYLDDGVEHEYLMTEGWLWTGQYPECAKCVQGRGNNQSMELDENTLNATWSKNSNGEPKFFIINEAIISKLCILGEEVEPCFEGSQITAPNIQFSFEDGFKEQLFSMMKELKDLLEEGGTKVFTRYAVEIGDTLWNAVWNHLSENYPGTDYCSMYRIEGIFEEDGQKFIIVQGHEDMKFYRLDFTLTEEDGFVPSDVFVEVTKSYTPAEEPQFALDAVEEYETEFMNHKEAEEEDKNDKEDSVKIEYNKEEEEETETEDEKEEEKCPECGKPLDECECEEEKEEEKTFSLDECEEYINLQTQYSELKEKFNSLTAEYENLKADKANLENQLASLSEFKANVEKKEKEAMISSFYMLSDEDKQDVIDNIDTYSLEDIEAKLSIICVRNKVSFNLEDDNNNSNTTFNLNSGDAEEESTPAWVKLAMSVAKTLN